MSLFRIRSDLEGTILLLCFRITRSEFDDFLFCALFFQSIKILCLLFNCLMDGNYLNGLLCSERVYEFYMSILHV